jgi:hypothetical protein
MNSTKVFVLTFGVAVMMGMPCIAQDVEPPFRWEGKGTGCLISEGGTDDIDFQFRLSVDEQGMVEGQTSNEDGVSRIKHVFYSDTKAYDFPGFFSRNLVIVLMLNEYGNTPMLCVLNGRLLVDKFFYGEAMLARYDEGSDIAKALGVGDPQATQMEEDELPDGVKSALRQCLPFGMVKIQGDYKPAVSHEAKETGTVSLFNGTDLDGWYMWLEEADADPKNVWKVQEGAIYCTGQPTGFIRTKKEYSDFKLVLEWRWPQEPGNSGVLLRMSGQEKVWPLCMEAQLMHNRAGDLIGMGCTFNENKAKKDAPISYTPRMNESSEKAPGGWNTYEITCKGGTIEVTINGQRQNKATGATIRKGYIGLQSEGAPIMFRNVTLTPLADVP